MGEFRVPYMGDIPAQEALIMAERDNLDAMAAIDRLQADAHKQIQRIFEEIWG